MIDFSNNFIDLEVIIANSELWRLTGYYGYPKMSRRRDAWNMLRMLSQMSPLPWCCVGDFNDLLTQQEKRGRL